MGVANALPDGDAAAFEALFAANYDDLLRYAVRRVGPDAAADVVADVMLVAWRRRREYSSEDARLWLFGVAHHVVANERRSALRRERLAERARQEAVTRPATADPAETDGEQVRALLATLPPAEQEALRLIEWDQLNIDEAARVTGCSRATFRVRLHRARRRFARLLAGQDVRPDAMSAATTSTKGVRP